MDTLPNGWCNYYLIQTLFPIETPVGQRLKRPIFWRGVCSNLICSQEIFRSIPSFSPKLFGILGMFLGENLPCVVQKINIASPTSNLRGADPFFGSGGGGGGVKQEPKSVCSSRTTPMRCQFCLYSRVNHIDAAEIFL